MENAEMGPHKSPVHCQFCHYTIILLLFWSAIASEDFRWPWMTWSYPATDCGDWEWSYTEGTNEDAERYSLMQVSSLQLTHYDYQRNN